MNGGVTVEHDFQDAFKNGRSAGNGAYARKDTTSRVMLASKPKVDQVGEPVPGIMDGSLCTALELKRPRVFSRLLAIQEEFMMGDDSTGHETLYIYIYMHILVHTGVAVWGRVRIPPP
jgi:hypothetical protein